ncbi:MAG: DUF3015 domain-containing protein [Nitrospira sp.]|nr:MAG: DUF3015 domain-containing protein [Nitrospira sp.]
MTRKLVFGTVAALFVVSQVGVVLAAPNSDTGPGCGLGKLAWAEYKNQKNIAPQVMMATTNGIFGSGTFGISSGTSGCTNDGQIMAEHKTNMFAAINFDNLSQEMAQGRGEHLAALASLMGVPAEKQADFFAMAQERYTALIQNGEANSVALIKALNEAMASHPVLAQVSSR